MRRLLAALAIAGIGFTAVPAVANTQAPTQDSVTGSFPGNRFILFSFDFDATSGPSGEDPGGSVYWGNDGATTSNWRGDVSCLAVSGNTAIIGFGGGYFAYYDPGQPFPELSEAYWVAGLARVTDVGPGPGDTIEWMELETGEPAAMLPPAGDPLPGPTDCSAFPPGGRRHELAGSYPSGNLVVTDAVDTSPSCAGRPATITGSGPVVGTPGADVIVGSDGDDTILGLGGDDVVCAGGGQDRVYAGAGTDAVFGGDGDDFIRGGPAGDLLLGQTGDDHLHGLRAPDTLLGQEGDDSLLGGPGDDRLDGGTGANSCAGGPGANTLTNCGAPGSV